MKDDLTKINRFHLSVAGDFYVADGWCMACEAPEHEAPALMASVAGSGHCYFLRQPQHCDEINEAVMAVAVSCCGAVRYSGTNLDVICRIWQQGSSDSIDGFHTSSFPVAVDPSWLSSTAVAIAQGIYDDKAFDRLPILADALQDAGCENDDILSHLRSNGPHVRGCWALDLVLGKK